MTEPVIHTDNDPQEGEQFEIFYILVTFKAKQEGNFQVAARSPEHAKQLALDALKDKEEIEIFQVINERDIKRFQEELKAQNAEGSGTLQ